MVNPLIRALGHCGRALSFEGAMLVYREQESWSILCDWRRPSGVNAEGLGMAFQTLEVQGEQSRVTTARGDVVIAMGLRSLLCIPLGEPSLPDGQLVVVTSKRPVSLTDSGVRVFELFCDLVRVIYRKTMDASYEADPLLEAELDARILLELKDIVRILEESGIVRRGHHARVHRLVQAMGERLPISEPELLALDVAAQVHDVGMYSGLEPQAQKGLRFMHAQVGGDILALLRSGELVARFVREHHESLDGFGFPQGMGGDRISLGGQVLAAAEYVIEVLEDTDLQTAIDCIASEEGGRFRPDVAHAAKEALQSGVVAD